MTLLFQLFVCVLFLFLLCFVVVNVAALNDVDAIENMADNAKEAGKNVAKANDEFSANVDKAVGIMKEASNNLNLSNLKFCYIKPKSPNECLKVFNELKGETKRALDELFLLKRLKDPFFLEELVKKRKNL